MRSIRLPFQPEVTMIARIWHGYTKPEHADAYEAMLKPDLLPGISKAKGYRGSYLLRKECEPADRILPALRRGKRRTLVGRSDEDGAA
jgi:hypothetical protein